jgi:hypothetical protein
MDAQFPPTEPAQQSPCQYIRCYTTPVHSPKQKKPPNEATHPHSEEGQLIRDIGAPYEGWCFVFDTETTTGTDQRLRVGFYEVHGIPHDTRMLLARTRRLTREALDTLWEAGVFYNPDTLSPAEITLIRTFAAEEGLRCLRRDAFIQRFYGWVHRRGALCIGHNLPFDLGTLARRWTDAEGSYRGGFSLQLCSCGHEHCALHPSVRIKTLGRYKARMAFQQVKGPQLTSGQRMAPEARVPGKGVLWGKFLDTATLGRALLGPGDMRLRPLGKRFRASFHKPDRPDLHGPITREVLAYGHDDVRATWAIYQAERALYRKHGVQKRIWTIYSEASLGKAYLQELGVPRFRERHPEFPPEVLGYGMVAYYGGRSEVHIRLHSTEVLYCDFKSQYPTVNALLGLQDLLLAERIDVRDATTDVRSLLATFCLEHLHDPAFWRRLRVLVKVRPDHDIFPVRTQFGREGLNIGRCELTGPAVWYALADVLASSLETGKAPEVLEALELVPEGRVETRPWKLFGDDRYTIDLARQDFFVEVINLRTEVKAELARAQAEHRPTDAEEATARLQVLDALLTSLTGEEAGALVDLGGLEVGLKLLASSSSYGVLVEMNQEEPTAEPKPLQLYGMVQQRVLSHVVERPGPYFAGPIGALIPAGGRLLLAIAERLAADRGLTYAHMDTDGITFARPEGMDRTLFQDHVRGVCGWFTPLSPYRGQPPILEHEKENDWEGQPEPLSFLGISAKRYVLYNRLPDGTFRIRKFSSHGVGTWQGREGYTSPAHIPEPCMRDEDGKPSAYKLGGERWHYDLWYAFIAAMESGHVWQNERGVPRYQVPTDNPWLTLPAFHRVTVSTAALLRTYGKVAGVRPFGFFTVLPALGTREVIGRQAAAAMRRETGSGEVYAELAEVPFYAPYAASAAELHDVRRSDTGEVMDGVIQFKTLAECLRDYFDHPEAKTSDPRGVGVLPRRAVRVIGYQHIGKEANPVKQGTAEETDGVVEGAAAGIDGAQRFGGVGGIGEVLRRYRMADLIRVTKVGRQTLYDLRSGKSTTPTEETLAAIMRGLASLDRADARSQAD